MIYIVEDDASIRELEQYALQTNGYQVQGFDAALDCRTAGASGPPCARACPTLSSWTFVPCCRMRDGYQILARLREDAATRSVPVLMVTAKSSEIDVVKGLRQGRGRLPVQAVRHHGVHQAASGCAALRAQSGAASAPAALRFGPIALDDVTRTVTVEEEPVELTFKEYALLHFFLEHPEEVLARERIMKGPCGIPTTCWSRAPSTCMCARCARNLAKRARTSAPCARWATSSAPAYRESGEGG